MKKILIFRHESWVGAAYFTDLLTELGIAFELIRIDQNEIIPQHLADDVAGLVFLGGTMSVNDSLPWIEQSLNLIQLAQQKKFPVLGHCLGSQLISKALGGTVSPMPNKEIGWHSIRFADNDTARQWRGHLPDGMKIMIWHHEEFSIPRGAEPLYATQHCHNQAFAIDNMVATVAHVELSEQLLNEWLDAYGDDIEPNDGSVQAIAEIKCNIKDKMAEMHTLSDSFYIKWLAMAYPQADNPDLHHQIKDYLQQGSCLCQAVRFYLKKPRYVVNCHCSECRKFHGNYAAYTHVNTADIHLFGADQLKWYQQTDNQARRGWCQHCGASLFWQKDSHSMCVAAGALTTPTHLNTTRNIYVENASDYYEIDANTDWYSATMKGASPVNFDVVGKPSRAGGNQE